VEGGKMEKVNEARPDSGGAFFYYVSKVIAAFQSISNLASNNIGHLAF
jgi:hypothetical protein